MKKIKLSKLKDDLYFVDPVTLERVCSFNQCIKKFTIEGFDEVTFFMGGKELKQKKYYHQCVECKKKYKSRNDKGKSYRSFINAICGNPDASDEKN